jgi:hypothetical protein
MSGWATADRIYSLPTTAQVGERIGVFVSSGNASYEIQLRTTAASNDTINGTDYDSADWSKLFITGECVIFRCVTANTAWIVEYDGRIPTKTAAYVNGDTDGTNSASTFIKPTDDGGTWTSLHDTGNTFSTSTGVITVRRDSKYLVTAQAFTPTTTGTRFDLQIKINSDSFVFLASTFDTNSNQFSSAFLSRCIDLSDGDTLTYETRYNLADHVLTGTRISSFSVVEVF